MSHPTGNANVRAAAMGFSNAGILGELNTAIAMFPGTLLERLSSINAFSQLRRRRFDPVLQNVTKTFPWSEVGRLVASKAGLRSLTKHEAGMFCVDAVYQNMDRRVMKRLDKVNKKGIQGVYAYEDGALQSFLKAKELGLQCFYDLPIGYWRTARKLLEKEKGKWPEWRSTLTGFFDSDIKLARKDKELRLADKIFVASSFTANTLKDFPGDLSSIEVIPYGFPEVINNRIYQTVNNNRRLKLLFVGSLSQRKGIANFFEAVKGLEQHIELTLVGKKVSDDCKALDVELTKHHWIPTLPHNEVLELMQQHDVLVFPSLFEGFGLVISEAMAAGTPVITTERTAGPDLIHHGENGWLIEAGSTDALKSAIEKILLDPKQIEATGRQAMETATKRPWHIYGAELAEAIMKHGK
jgi:glycosyltransferase involved in cell wall biosynthesis